MTDSADDDQALLASIDSPADLRRLSRTQLLRLAEELREFIIASVARSGGHLAAGLGALELTVALHYLYDTPDDALVWDIGHQAYPHKVLTGRRARLGSIRRQGGLSGFLRRDESAYDAFGAGHSSTSISAAVGMALADAHRGLAHRTVAIIGDGALTAGMAFEALDHAGASRANLLVILNDNGMSISPNVGALCASLRTPDAGALFEQLGFSYTGPVDGHDLPTLLATLESLRDQTGPRLLHVITHKGHGYEPALRDPVGYHGVSPFQPEVGLKAAAGAQPVTYSQVFGDWLCEAAALHPDLVAITPAMREGSGMVRFAAQYPGRYVDVGIAEQHSITLAAGMACRGLKPVVAIYSTFLQRGYDQLIHDVCIQKLPVVFALDRAGLVGPDGATHAGSFDLSFLRCIPGLVVMAPSDGAQLRQMLHAALRIDGPVAVRYPRAVVDTAGLREPVMPIPTGTAQLCRSGRRVALLSFGALLPECLHVAARLDATVVDMRFVKPLDERMVLRMARDHDLLVTVEDNAVAGGAGSAVAELLAARGRRCDLLQLGLPDEFPEHASREQSLAVAGLDAASMQRRIGARLGGQVRARGTSPARSVVVRELARGAMGGFVEPAASGS